jgi:5-formyltetrahydrofolate cyclo-ligase
MLAQRQALPEIERLARSRRAWPRLTALPCYRVATIILGYMAFDKEVLTDGLLRQAIAAGKQVALPLVQAAQQQLALYAIRDIERDVAPGFRGILEPQRRRTSPVDVEAVELAIVPGVAFDFQGGRLGFGAGFYDRLLSRFPPGIPKIGLAFDFQITPRLPRQWHDIALDAIVTESRVISCTPLSTHDGAAAVAWTTRTDRGEGEV